MGNNEEAIAGTKPRRLIIDEIGKGNFLRGLQAAIPGFHLLDGAVVLYLQVQVVI